MTTATRRPGERATHGHGLRLLLSFAVPHRRQLLIGLALAVVGSAAQLATPMVTKTILDTFGSSRSVAGPVTLLAVLVLVSGAAAMAMMVVLGTVGERVIFHARTTMIGRYFGATLPSIERRSPGELVTRVTSDTVLLREASSSALVGLVNGAVMVAGTLLLMALLDPVLLGATVAVIGVVGAAFLRVMPTIARAQEQAQDHVGHLGGRLEGFIRAIRSVKAARAEHRAGEALIDDARRSMTHSLSAVRGEAVAWTIAWTGMQVATIMILALGAWRVSAGHLEVSALVAFLLYAFGIVDPIMELSQNTTNLQAGIAAARRIHEAAALPQEPAVPRHEADASTIEADAPVLTAREVSASYEPGSEMALRGVSFAVPRHGHTAIVGPSGSGKTTLFLLLLRFMEPTEGVLMLDGRPFAELRHDQVRARLGYVEQDAPLVPGTIRQNLTVGHPDATDNELWAALEAVQLTDEVALLPGGLDAAVSAASLSGGQRQRLALARALVRPPDVLLLDEATAQLDARTEQAISGAIRHLAEQHAVVTIAHRLSTVVSADQIIVLDRGRIRATGTHAELVQHDPLYRSLVDALQVAR